MTEWVHKDVGTCVGFYTRCFVVVWMVMYIIHVMQVDSSCVSRSIGIILIYLVVCIYLLFTDSFKTKLIVVTSTFDIINKIFFIYNKIWMNRNEIQYWKRIGRRVMSKSYEIISIYCNNNGNKFRFVLKLILASVIVGFYICTLIVYIYFIHNYYK